MTPDEELELILVYKHCIAMFHAEVINEHEVKEIIDDYFQNYFPHLSLGDKMHIIAKGTSLNLQINDKLLQLK